MPELSGNISQLWGSSVFIILYNKLLHGNMVCDGLPQKDVKGLFSLEIFLSKPLSNNSDTISS